MKYRVRLSVLLMISMLAGCSFPLENMEKQFSKEEKEDTLGLAPDFSYEVLEQTPNIMINQIGYSNDAGKVAILRGNHLEEEFKVYNALTQKEEFKGTLKSDKETTGEKETEENTEEMVLYLADFSQLKKSGTYYLYHSDLGYSYEFKIDNHIYGEVEKKVLNMAAQETKDTSLICYQMASLLMTKELYSDNLLEEAKFYEVCQEKIQYLMQAQDEVTGNVYADISKAELIKNLDNGQKQQYISLAATAEFAGVMAFYAYQMKEVDQKLYKECLTAAEKAYATIQNSLDNVGYDAGYFAAAHLYRLTNKSKYAQAVGQYLLMMEEQKSYTEYDFSLFADYAYITVRSGSNLEWSESIMKKIMKRAEEISLSAGKNTYYVSEQREKDDIDGKLQEMSVLALVNYIITNHEYTVLQKNYLDYFLGRNSENFCYLEGFGSRSTEKKENQITAKNCGLFYLLLQSTKM